MKAYLIMFTSGALLTLGDIFMKKWVVSKTAAFYAVGLAVYFIGLNFLAQSYLLKHIAVATVIVNIFNVVTLSLVSWIVFKDCLTAKQIAGVIMALFAIILMES